MKGEIMQQKIIFDIKLPINRGSKLKHIKEKSCYDSNYYQLNPYGDWVDFGRDDNSILHQRYHECANCYTYDFGHFEGDRFISAFGYTCHEDILDGIDIE